MDSLYPVGILENILKKYDFSRIIVEHSVYTNNPFYSDKHYVVTHSVLKSPDVYGSYVVNIFDKSMLTFKDLLVDIFNMNPNNFEEVLKVINYFNETTEFENYVPYKGVSFIYFDHISKLIVSPIGSHFNLCINTVTGSIIFECVGGGKELETIEPIYDLNGEALLAIGNKTLLQYIKYYLNENLLTSESILKLKHFSIGEIYSQLPIASYFNYIDRSSTYKFFQDHGFNLNSGYSVSFEENDVTVLKKFFREVFNSSDYKSFIELVEMIKIKQKLESNKFKCLFSIHKIFKTERLNHCSVCAYTVEFGLVKLTIGLDLLNVSGLEPDKHRLFKYEYNSKSWSNNVSSNLSSIVDMFKNDFAQQIATVVEKDVSQLSIDDLRLYEIMFEKKL
jgi:hypothetical protein